ncbi:MAG: oxidoreductase [Bacteroidota bacterium]|nr:oxidoreductase [Bacteroidota bacterium]
MENPIKTAIIGFGLSGKVFHAPFLHTHPGFELTKILQRHSNSSKEIYPYVEVARDFDNILQDKEIELVAICTPNTTHFDFAKKTLKAGKHIVIEKPFTNTSREADKLIELSKNLNKKIFVYHNRRWDNDFLTIQKVLKNKLIGKLVEYECHFDRFKPVLYEEAWRDIDQPGSGILYDLGSHLIDQALLLFGKPNSIFADIRAQRPGSQVDDYFELSLHYPDHKVILKAGMMVKAPLPRFILHGDQGSFIKHGLDPQEAELKAGKMPEGPDWGVEPKVNWGKLYVAPNGQDVTRIIGTIPGSYMDFYQNVYDVLRNDATQAIRPEEARDVIRVIEMAFLSQKEKRLINFE